MMYRGTGCAHCRTRCDVALECVGVLGNSTWCTIGVVVHKSLLHIRDTATGAIIKKERF